MGIYARIHGLTGKVINVIEADNSFIEGLSDYDMWVEQTDKTGICGIGYVYSSVIHKFTPIQPYPSWVLNETTRCWEPPVAYPDHSKNYTWDEENTVWVLQE
jgi:hypothetical protein